MQPEVYREMADVQARHWWFAARRRILAALLRQLSLPENAEILEIGCGTGANLSMLADFGHLQALEYDDAARGMAAALGVCDVVAGALPGPLPFAPGQFDLICLLDVLEHVADDTAALAQVRHLLKPGGVLLITVPAYRWLWSAHDTAHHHYRRYTAGRLAGQARAAGLAVSRLGYFNSLLFPPIAGIRLIQRLTGRSTGSDAALPAPLINRLLAGLFGFERHIVPHALFPFGTSVMGGLGAPPRPDALPPGVSP